MKQILAILTLIASLTFTSCEDFLTEEVRGQQNLDTYFQSVEEAESFITGCYQAITFGGWWNINTVWLLSEMCSDDGWMGNTTQSQSDYISLAHYQGTGQSNGAISNFWQYRYKEPPDRRSPLPAWIFLLRTGKKLRRCTSRYKLPVARGDTRHYPRFCRRCI